MSRAQTLIIRAYMMAAAVMVALLFVPATAHAQDVDTDLVAHWTFDNDSGSTITDSSGNNNDGTWVDGGDNNISGEIVQGVNGRGLRFAADTNIQASIFPTGAAAPYTVSIWLKPYNINSAGQSAIWRAGPDSPTCQNGPKLGKVFELSNYNFEANNQCSGSPRTAQYVYDDTWYNTVVVYDGTNLSLYLNGVLQESVASNYNGTHPQAAAFRLGDTTSNTILADMDDLRVYSRALTAQDVEAIFDLQPANIKYDADARVPKYFNGTDWVAMGEVKYAPTGVYMNGVDSAISETPAGISISDSAQGTISAWFRTTTTDPVIFIKDNGGSPSVIDLSVDSGNRISFLARDTTQNILVMRSSNAYDFLDGNWHHVVLSYDLSDPTQARSHMYVDGVADKNITTWVSGQVVDLTDPTGDWAIAKQGTTFYEVSVADLWFDTGTYLDLSIPANLNKFIDGGEPVFLGTSGGIPTGSPPEFFFSGDISTWHTNKGTGGGFTENGEITTVSSPAYRNYIWQQLGNTFDPAGTGESSLAVLSTNEVAAYYDNNGTGSLSKVVFDGTDWSQVGNTLSAGGNNAKIAALDHSTVVIGGTLRVFRFNGTDWVQVGNDYAAGRSRVAKLSNNMIAASTANSLAAYSWDGTDFSLVGNARGILDLGRGTIAALNENTVVGISETNGLQAYQFDGTDWLDLGNNLAVPFGRVGGTALDETTIAVKGDSSDLTVYSFNGTDWSSLGTPLNTAGSEVGMSKLDGNTIVMSNTNTTMRALGFAYCSAPLRAPGSMIYNADSQVMQYCDGANWQAMGPVPGDGAGGCSNPTRPEGSMIYNSDHAVMQYCEGDEWVGVGSWSELTGPTGCPSIGDTCDDGSIYAGLSPDGNVPMYTTPADALASYNWNDGSSNWLDTAMVNCANAATPGPQASCQTGESNTVLLVSLNGSGSPSPYQAAEHCNGLSAHGYDDWYLPASDELKVLYDNKNIGDLNGTFNEGPLSGRYWSSTEANNQSAWSIRFSDKGQNGYQKNSTLRVRCIRKN